LPQTTRAFIAVDNADRLEAAWNQTQTGQLASSAEMKPFVEEADRYFHQFALPNFVKTTGTTIDELRSVASGQMSGALVEAANGSTVTMIIVDVAGKTADATALLKTISERFTERGTTGESVKQDGADIRSWKWKIADSGEARTSVWLLKDDTLLFSTNLAEVDNTLKRWAQPETSLSTLDSFRKSSESCNIEGMSSPALRWYVDPIGLLRLVHKPGPFDEPEDHPAEFAKRHGLDAVKAISGNVTGAVAPYDLIVRVTIYAPKPHRGTMAIFDFPGDADLTTGTWVPNSVNMLTTLNFNLTSAFENIGGLFDDLYADGIEGTFNDIMTDLKADDGPRVDVRNDVIEKLSSQISILNESELPIAGKNERSFVSVQIANDEDGVAQAVKRMLRDDPGVRRYRVTGYPNDLWTIGESTERDNEEEGAPRLRTLAVMVARKQLMIATSAQAIRSVLTQATVEPVADAEEFKRVMAAIAKLNPQGTIGRAWSNVPQDIETTYELVRSGRLEEVESVYGMIVGMAIKRFRDAETGESKIDFNKLPEFSSIRHYFGTAGLVGENVTDAWRITGFTLSKE
ncbi:MAG: hypothetical protein O3B86_06640, partial [Planctomycetota bacterium]|nr:hypothetical protein [Planctomycetota bacterium]